MPSFAFFAACSSCSCGASAAAAAAAVAVACGKWAGVSDRAASRRRKAKGTETTRCTPSPSLSPAWAVLGAAAATQRHSGGRRRLAVATQGNASTGRKREKRGKAAARGNACGRRSLSPPFCLCTATERSAATYVVRHCARVCCGPRREKEREKGERGEEREGESQWAKDLKALFASPFSFPLSSSPSPHFYCIHARNLTAAAAGVQYSPTPPAVCRQRDSSE